MTKRILALLLTLCLMISAAPVFAGAATGQQVSANAVTVTAGNTASVTLKAENFTNIAALDVYVYYDASVLTVSSTSTGSKLSGEQSSVNTAQAGEIKLSAMSLNGISGSGNLLTVYFQTSADCTPGTYPIEVAIGRAYDTNLAVATVGRANGSVTVNKPVVTETFKLYSSVSANTLQKGDVLSYSVRNSGWYAFVSGEFTVEYDRELFAFKSLELDPALTGEGAVYSVNSNVPGIVRIAYANDTPVSDYYLFTLELTVIADTDTTTTLKAQASNVYREDLTAFQPGSRSTTVTLQKLPEVVDHANVLLKTGKLEVGKQTKSTFCVEAGAGIAAADFTVTYDPQVLRCVAVTMLPEAEEKGGMVIINDHFTEGTIRFSYVNMDAYAGELSLVQITWKPLSSPAEHYQSVISAVGVVDSKQNPITLEYVTDTGCIFVPTVVPPSCLEDGYTDHTCGCGESYQTDPTEKLGHDIQYFEKREPTCTLTGFEAHEGCSRCDYGDFQQLPALGHDEITHEAKAPSCLEIGWTEYVTCSRCDHSTYQELPALGHRIVETSTEVLDPIAIENNSTVPFEVIDGWYYSANHDHGSSSEITATASYNCSVKLTYSVSSEANYDKLLILKNGNTWDEISGNVQNREWVAQLVAGDVLTIRYTKDVSVSRDDDCGWVKLEWDQIQISSFVDVPTENFQPDCTNGVVCDYCQTEVKPALGHSYETVTIDATCTVDGSITNTCYCGDTQVEAIPATGHSYEAVVTAPTCTEAGYTTYTCHCGDTYTADEVAALGHSYETVTVDATCTADGSITTTCTNCGDTQVEAIPATGHSFADGICGACGEADPDYVKPVVKPTLKLKAPALEFKDMITVNAFFTAENIQDVVEMGMVTYTEKVAVVDVATASHVIPGATLDESTGRYFASSQGIHAKYLGDTVYLSCYAKLTDGSYVYTTMASYSPVQYATNQLKNSTNTALKQLCAAMLNYGAAAQNYFGYNTDVLANSTLTAEQIALPEAYTSDMVGTVPAAPKDKQGAFASNKGFGTRKPAVSFEGAFSINYFFTPSYTPVDGITLYYWTEADYAAADVLTVENATGAVAMTDEGSQFRGDVEGIAAKDLAKAVYVAAVYSDGTTTWTSGVLGYSIGVYCSNQATGTGTMAELAKATTVYGYHAKAYFG